MVTIDTNIAPPAKKAGGRARRFDLPIKDLKVNNSFLVLHRTGEAVPYTCAMQRNVIGMIKHLCEADAIKGTFNIRKWTSPEGKDLIRVYRVQ